MKTVVTLKLLCNFATAFENKYTMRQDKSARFNAIKMIISSTEIANQEELLQELAKSGFELTQATLSRDLKQMKVAKAAGMNGRYVYVLPNDTMYKRVSSEKRALVEMVQQTGFVSIRFSSNLAVIRTKPGYASGLAYDIDDRIIFEVLGTVAGDDTILLVLREGANRETLIESLRAVIPNIAM